MNLSKVVEKCKDGDSEAWNMIIDKYSKRIYNIALNFAGNGDDAADITQDIFLKVYNNIEKFKEEKNFHSWILKISKNYCIDYWRKNKMNVNRVDLDDRLIREERTPEDSVVKEFDIMVLRDRLLLLEPDLRLLLIMRDIQDFSYQDIADYLNIPLGTVKSRINRARIKLAKIYLNEGK
jgi:RNA polymerase sigma-70 factor (ECF subfamily)